MASIPPHAVVALVDRICTVQASRLHGVAAIAGRAAVALSHVAPQARAMVALAERTQFPAQAARAIIERTAAPAGTVAAVTERAVAPIRETLAIFERINANRYHPRSFDDV